MKESAISLDTTTWLYFLDIGAYGAYFESICYDSGGICRSFGSPIFGNFRIGNRIVGKTSVFGHHIYAVYDLEKHTKTAYIASDMAGANFTIKNREYAVMAFMGIWGKIRWHTDFCDSNYRLEVTERGSSVTHAVFESVVFETKWNLGKSKSELLPAKKSNGTDGISLTDIFWFSDPFGETDLSDFLDFLKYLGDSEVFLDNGDRVAIYYESIDVPTFPIAKIDLRIIAETPAMALEPRKNDEIRSWFWAPPWTVPAHGEPGAEKSARSSHFSRVPTDEILRLFSCVFPRFSLMNGPVKKKYLPYFPLIAIPNTEDLLRGVKDISIPDSQDLLSYSEKSVAFLQGIVYLEYIGYILESQRQKTGLIISDTPADTAYSEFAIARNISNLKSLETQREHFSATLREYFAKIKIYKKI